MAILGSLLTDDSRRDSGLLTEEDPNHVISSMQNSMWGGKYMFGLAGVGPFSYNPRYDATSGRRRWLTSTQFLLFSRRPLDHLSHIVECICICHCLS